MFKSPIPILNFQDSRVPPQNMKEVALRILNTPRSLDDQILKLLHVKIDHAPHQLFCVDHIVDHPLMDIIWTRI